MLLEQIDLLKNLYDLPLNPWRRSGKEGTPLWLRSPDAIISLKVVRCVGDVNEQHQVMGSTKNRPTWYQSQPRRVTVFRSLRSRVFFSRKPEIILGWPRSPGDVSNVMATPDFPFIAEHRNIASISRPCDTFERSTCRIEGVICVTKICSMRCIFAGMQKKFIVSALNGITISKKIRDQTLTLIEGHLQGLCHVVEILFILLGNNQPLMLIMFSVTML